MHFTKMQTLGNDYLYVYGAPIHASELAIKLSDRHYGAGADGMIWISPSAEADFSMRIFNADGTEAEMSGNGIRCVGKYVFDKGYTDQTTLKIDTLAGVRTLHLQVAYGKVERVAVEMGKAIVSDDMTVTVGNESFAGVPVNMGNPHFVIFANDVESVPVAELGAELSHHAAFAEGANIEFVQLMEDHSLRMRVWERGMGVTMACGTGACAAAAAAVKKGYCYGAKETFSSGLGGRPIKVKLDGGTLTITVSPDDSVTMTGPAEFVYEGETV